MSAAVEIANKLMGFEDAVSIALQIKDDNYFDAVQGILDNFAVKKKLESIYVAAAIPSRSIIDALKVLEIDLSGIHFVDCISYIMLGYAAKEEQVLHIESPTMLENITLKVKYLMRKTKNNNVVIIDSINALAIHNDIKILSEFLHILVSNLRAKNVYTIILTMKEHSSDEINEMIGLVCDEIIEMDEKRKEETKEEKKTEKETD